MNDTRPTSIRYQPAADRALRTQARRGSFDGMMDGWPQSGYGTGRPERGSLQREELSMTKEAGATETRAQDKVDATQGAEAAHSGLDTQGEFRLGARYTLAVRGSKLAIREAHSGREKEVSEADLEGLLKDTYFAD